MTTETNMQDQITAFAAGMQEIVNEDFAKNYSNLVPPTIEIQWGRRYARVVERRDFGCSVMAFVDMTNGDLLKPASFKAPAKHARGNILKNSARELLGPRGCVPYLR